MMRELKMIRRWLAAAAIFQSTMIFVVDVALTEKLSTIRRNLTSVLYRNQVPTISVDQVSEALSSISNFTLWFFLGGIALTCVGYGLLRRVILRDWPRHDARDPNDDRI
jgi:hypothetical protein